MQAIIYTQQDGTLAIVVPYQGARLATQVTLQDVVIGPREAQPVDRFMRRWPVDGAIAKWAETEDEFVARIAKKDVPADAVGVQIIDASSIPSDRTFRNAWKAGNGCIEHDMAKCREIHRNRMRDARKSLFAVLDVEYMRADEAGNVAKKLAVAKKKQELRDVTADPRIESAKTPEELKAVWPDCLK